MEVRLCRVAEWLRYESVDMTRRTYEHEARLHRKKFGGAWLERAFKVRQLGRADEVAVGSGQVAPIPLATSN